MIHNIHLGGQDRPLTFAYSAAYEYELSTGKFYEQDVAELAVQVIAAGAMLKTDNLGEAARTISMVKYLDIAYAALRAGHLKTRTPINFTVHDVADWFGEDKKQASRFTELLLQANFNLKPDPDEQEEQDDDPAKKKRPAQLTGTNS